MQLNHQPTANSHLFSSQVLAEILANAEHKIDFSAYMEYGLFGFCFDHSFKFSRSLIQEEHRVSQKKDLLFEDQ